MPLTVRFLGTRGAFPLNIPQTQLLGTETSCVVLETGQDRLILDAGTGLNHLEPSERTDIILLSHFHYDHILGLPYFLSRKTQGKVILVTSCASDIGDFASKLAKVFGGIGFPVRLSEIFKHIDLRVFDPSAPLTISKWIIDTIELNHPGKAFGYRVQYEGRRGKICYLMDHEQGDSDPCEALINFAKNTELIIYDAAYSDAEYAQFRGYGHSTIEQGQIFSNMTNCRRIMLMGHAMERLDSRIQEIEDQLNASIERLARDGDVIVI